MSGHQTATIGDTVYFWFAANDTSGSGGDGATPEFIVREAGAAAGAEPLLSDVATLLTHADYPDGCHEIAVAATVGNGFAADDTFSVFCTIAIDSQNPAGMIGSCTLTPLAKAAALATAQTDLDTITGTGGVLIGTDAMDRSGTLDVNTKTVSANAITATAINADAITNAKIADDAIAAENLATGALTADAFAADAIVAATLATGALTADAFAADAIVAATLATGSLTADAFAANALVAATFAASSLDDKGDWNTTTPPTVDAVADQVWEETLADHSGTAGSTAEALNAAGAAGDPWTTALPGAYGAGSAGKIIGDNINAPLNTIDTVVDGIVTDISNLNDFDPAADTVAQVTLCDTITTYTGNTKQTGDTYALANGATGFAAIDTVVDSILEDTGTTIPGLFTFTTAGVVDANVERVNNVALTGTGVLGDEWGP